MQKYLYDRNDLFRRGIKLSNTTLLRMEAAGKFPARCYLTPRTVCWPADEVEAHLAGLVGEEGGEADG
ncbi:MAG: AlpA family phage regulatory protein [Pseudomonadota bacterium]